MFWKNKKGFTLVELVIVITIMMIMGTMVITIVEKLPWPCENNLSNYLLTVGDWADNYSELTDKLLEVRCDIKNYDKDLITSLLSDVSYFANSRGNQIEERGKSKFISNLNTMDKNWYFVPLESDGRIAVNNYLSSTLGDSYVDQMSFVINEQEYLSKLIRLWVFNSIGQAPIIEPKEPMNWEPIIWFFKFLWKAIGYLMIWFSIGYSYKYLVNHQLKYRRLFTFLFKSKLLRKIILWIKDEVDFDLYLLFQEMFGLSQFDLKGLSSYKRASLSFNWNEIVSVRVKEMTENKNKVTEIDCDIKNLWKEPYPEFITNMILEKLNIDIKIKIELEKIENETKENIRKRDEKYETVNTKLSFINFVKDKESSLPKWVKDWLAISKSLQDITDEYNAIAKKAEVLYKSKV